MVIKDAICLGVKLAPSIQNKSLPAILQIQSAEPRGVSSKHAVVRRPELPRLILQRACNGAFAVDGKGGKTRRIRCDLPAPVGPVSRLGASDCLSHGLDPFDQLVKGGTACLDARFHKGGILAILYAFLYLAVATGR